MLKKDMNKLLKSYETVHKNNGDPSYNMKGSWESDKLLENRSKRIDAWKNSRS